MQYQFLNIFLEQKELTSQVKKHSNRFLLENNLGQIEQIYKFYKNKINLLYVSGFLGTGKAKIIDYSLSFLSAETIVLRYNCFNSTVLDDVLLSFFSDFKNMSAQNIISEPKIKTENFTQKINSYFSQIEKPFVIILDSFEAISVENRQELLDFILHLNSLEKVKIIIIGRTFEGKYFNDIELERVTTFALERQIFEKYLKSEKIKVSNAIFDEFYKHTRGYYFFTSLSIKLMKNECISLVDFLTKLQNSYLPFHKFLAKEALSLIPAIDRNLFWFLATIRHPISIDLLKKLKLYDEEKIDYLISNLIVILENSQIYVQDYLKDEVEETVASHIIQRIRQYIIDLYLTQLPLKPLDRNICISRQTMRKEIEYHKLFLPKRPKNLENLAIDINYLSYSKVFEIGEKSKAETVDSPKKPKPAVSPLEFPRKKNININLENLPFQQGDREVSQAEYFKEEASPITESLSLREIIQQAKKAEINYDYAKVIELYNQALLLDNDIDYKSYVLFLYTKLAHAYQKVADYENSLKYYNLAKSIYESTKDFVKVNLINFNIAKIFHESYKIEKAKKLFLEIAESKNSPNVLVVKSYIQLANLKESLSNQQLAFEYYKRAIENSSEEMSPKILSELYFKYALILDDKNDEKTAIEFYNKCVNLSGDFRINKFLSSAYSNIATLYLEKNDIENAIFYYKKAYEIDKQSDNLEGMYYSSSKLASILQRRQPEEAIKYFNIGLDSARIINDVFYIVSASLAIGDYYYDKKQDEMALKNYINALNLAIDTFSKDNINKINIRINDIKFRLGIERYENLVEIIREQENE